ncbi:hypothetical protein HRI_004489200 [Hibiscus trionum]|uniref:Secreted protein n=1 Tax=Hibiscus trionum TaxID=183268 RepID=A0A9W7MQV7_HIBTR|nr:hypothetical protein HRI_004489200 [Hibiscus trionum]
MESQKFANCLSRWLQLVRLLLTLLFRCRCRHSQEHNGKLPVRFRDPLRCWIQDQQQDENKYHCNNHENYRNTSVEPLWSQFSTEKVMIEKGLRTAVTVGVVVVESTTTIAIRSKASLLHSISCSS